MNIQGNEKEKLDVECWRCENINVVDFHVEYGNRTIVPGDLLIEDSKNKTFVYKVDIPEELDFK